MKPVVFVDEKGWKRRAFIRDDDGDEMARSGIPGGPPSLDDIDWEVLKKEINNSLADQGLFTWKDIQGHPVGLGVICSAIKRYVSGLYREQDQIGREIAESSRNKNGRKSR